MCLIYYIKDNRSLSQCAIHASQNIIEANSTFSAFNQHHNINLIQDLKIKFEITGPNSYVCIYKLKTNYFDNSFIVM